MNASIEEQLTAATAGRTKSPRSKAAKAQPVKVVDMSADVMSRIRAAFQQATKEPTRALIMLSALVAILLGLAGMYVISSRYSASQVEVGQLADRVVSLEMDKAALSSKIATYLAAKQAADDATAAADAAAANSHWYSWRPW